jgi:hypothetical protein
MEIQTQARQLAPRSRALRSVLATLCVGAAGVAVVWAARQHPASVRIHSAEVVSVAPALGSSRAPSSLAVFRAPRSSADALPLALRRDADRLAREASGQGLGSTNVGTSRRVSGSAYVWPIGAAGYCIGVASFGTQCVRAFPAERLVGPSLLAQRDNGHAAMAFLVDDRVVGVTIRVGAATLCAGRAVHNGFECSLRALPAPQRAKLFVRTRDGATHVATLAGS